MITYRELLRYLNSMPKDRLDDTVTVLVDTEFYGVDAIEVADEDTVDALDAGHVFLTV